MSYILDALRRADAERAREREPVPGLNARPVLAAGGARMARRLSPALVWLALGLALGAVLMWAAGWMRPGAVPPAPPVEVAPAQTAAVPAAPVAAPAAPASAPTLFVVVAPPPPQPAPAPVAAPAPRAPAPAPGRPTPLAELSAEMRSQWPHLAIGGAIYSDSPTRRFVIVNGQVVREGEAAAPGVIVERIGPKSAVMRWRDLRVEVSL